MASKARAILGAVRTALAAVNGTGVYVHNLTGSADCIKGGRPLDTDFHYPACWVAAGPLTSTHGPQLGRYRRELVIDLQARAAAPGTPDDRGLIAADLLNDITIALEQDRTLGGTVLDIIVEGMSIDGDEAGIPGVAIAMAVVKVYWHANSGAGV